VVQERPIAQSTAHFSANLQSSAPALATSKCCVCTWKSTEASRSSEHVRLCFFLSLLSTRQRRRALHTAVPHYYTELEA
jgi:hypothetical protein